MSIPVHPPSSRFGALAGFGFAAGILLQNGVLLQGAPLPSASLDVVEAFYRDHTGRISVAVGWVAINIPLLLAFGASVRSRMAQHPSAAVCGQIGFGGVVLLSAAFMCTTWLQAVLAARASALAASGHLALVWDFHSAAFGGSGIALSLVLGGFSVGALYDGTTPRWTAIVGLAGAASLVVSGLLAVGTVSGGPGIFFQLAGFLAWVVWLLTASTRLWRVAPV